MSKIDEILQSVHWGYSDDYQKAKAELLQLVLDEIDKQYDIAIKEEKLKEELRHGQKWFLFYMRENIKQLFGVDNE